MDSLVEENRLIRSGLEARENLKQMLGFQLVSGPATDAKMVVH